jgi:hypothetical protein
MLLHLARSTNITDFKKPNHENTSDHPLIARRLCPAVELCSNGTEDSYQAECDNNDDDTRRVRDDYS